MKSKSVSSRISFTSFGILCYSIIVFLLFETMPIVGQESTGVSFWIAADSLQVREGHTNSEDVETFGKLPLGTEVIATHIFDSWLKIKEPMQGWIFGPALIDSESELKERIANNQVIKSITQHNIWLEEDAEDVSHLIWSISGKLSAKIKMGIIQAPEPRLYQCAYIRYLSDQLPKDMPLLGKAATMQSDDIFLFTEKGWIKIGKWVPSEYSLLEVNKDEVNTGKSIQGMSFKEPLPTTN